MCRTQYPPVSEQVKKRCRWLLTFAAGPLASARADAAAASEAAPFSGAVIDANALGWALAAVSSRAYRTRGPSLPAAMLPLIDICNHSFEPNVAVKPGKDGAVEVRALQPLSAGTPLLQSYGNLSNDFLLMDYGFVVPGNPHDRAALHFSAGLLDFAREVAGLGAAPFGAPDTPATAAASGEDVAALPWQRALLTELKLYGAGKRIWHTAGRSGVR